MLKFRIFVPLIWMLASWPEGAAGQEFRAMWADAFHSGFFNSSQTTDLVAAARAANCNAIVVEVRKRGDAYYQNGLEPVATNVSPQTFDPLADLIQKAHTGSPRIEIHAWIVAYNIWGSQATPPTQPTHPYNLHPDWLTQKMDGTKWDGGNYLFDPAHPGVQQHTYNVCMDIINRYDVDGFHFDYIRYPDSGSSANNQPWGYNPVSVQRYQQLTGTTTTPAATNAVWLQWRRNQVTALVRKVYLNAWAVKPQVRISAALIAYGNAPVNLNLATWQNTEPYARVLQDWRGWMEEGILDLACPMIYGSDNTRFDGWSDYAKDRKYNRACAPGMGWYLNTVSNTITQIGLARDPSANGNTASGIVGYSYAVPNISGASQSSTWSSLAAGPFATTAAIPGMPWKTGAIKGHAMGLVFAGDNGDVLDGATVTITGPVNRTVLTDGTGFFGAIDLPVGSYSLSIDVPGFQPLIRSFTVTAGNVSQPATALVIVPFRVTNTVRPSGGNTVTITWNSVPGRKYLVEQAPNVGQWSTAVSGLIATGASSSYVWTIPPNWEKRAFLRVALEP